MHLPRGVHLAHLGDRLRFSGDHRGQGHQARISRREAAVHAGDRRQPAARAFPRRPRAAGDRAVLRFRMDQAQSCSTAPTSARNPASNDPTSRPRGCPSPEELALLEPLRDRAARRSLRRGGDAAGFRRLAAATASCLAQASKLLVEAGWKRQGNLLVNDKGETLAVSKSWSTTRASCASCRPGSRTCRRSASTRRSGRSIPRSMQARQADFDFDLISMALLVLGHADARRARRASSIRIARDAARLAQPAGNCRPGRRRADRRGRRCRRTAQELTVAMRALDRVLRARMDWIPSWYSANHRGAFWDMFGFKEPKPDYGFPVESAVVVRRGQGKGDWQGIVAHQMIDRSAFAQPARATPWQGSA